MSETVAEGRPTHVIGVADYAISTSADDLLVTYALGSCLGITLFDKEAGVGALVHCLLPSAKKSPEKGELKPAMFVDTGMVHVMKELRQVGADVDRLIIKVAGGANPIDGTGMFKVGERNHTVLRKILWQNGLFLEAEDVGGTKPRTMLLHMMDGRVMVKSEGKETAL